MKGSRAAASVVVLSAAFRAFYDLRHASYLAYTAARLPADEVPVAVSHTFGLVAANWTTAVARPSPAAYAWNLHTSYVVGRTGTRTNQKGDVALMHDDLHLPVDRIATLTGKETATVTALLSAAHR
ncbi:hypothetical protein [Streptomyces sp. Ncost-T10-10d]|uniref:hypothetical protein n=1 Tax=Streptomyces sp. Ncost-T10-10d TaxID=1839774 RepID=UPI00081F61C5|nr:hypothetical protein [Streptomyces sp. Ncost-T10-10d]SCF67635.1 hypothetical protein GA0115254_111024 [Streptomyces sp. Ncost-T10-10d]